MPSYEPWDAGPRREHHCGATASAKGRCCRSCTRCRRRSAHVPRRRCAWWRTRSTSRAPKCTASSPSTMTSAARRPGGTCSSSAGRKPARRRAATRWPRAPRRGSASRSATPRRTAASRSSRSIASASAPRRRPPCSTAAWWGGSTQTRLDRSAGGGAAMTLRVFIPRDAGARRGRRRRGRGGVAQRPPSAAVPTSRSCAPARAGFTGWSRWSRSRRRRAASAYGPVDAGRCRRPARCGALHWRRSIRCASGRPRRFPGSSGRRG